MNKRTNATGISTKVRKTVMERDKGHCIYCNNYQMLSIAHYVARSKSGLGIEQNLAVVCMPCHIRLDQSIYRKEMLLVFKNYLTYHYGEFETSDLQFKKGQ